ncbi:MmcQ/YjbR family DNA-binding protein, partial [Listeria monocytogenes]|nr:MmcQ/YjbR family DNA-binding protein [Listeria monocytogenes]
AYHMNKNHWLTALLDGSVSEKQLQSLLRDSYERTR